MMPTTAARKRIGVLLLGRWRQRRIFHGRKRSTGREEAGTQGLSVRGGSFEIGSGAWRWLIELGTNQYGRVCMGGAYGGRPHERVTRETPDRGQEPVSTARGLSKQAVPAIELFSHISSLLFVPESKL